MTRTTPFARPALSTSVLAVLAMLPLGCQGEAAKPEEEHAAPVKWEAPEKATLEEWTELLGTTQPLPGNSARVSAAVEGRVLWVLSQDRSKPGIVEGQRVTAGQVLVQLDDRVLKANRAKIVAAEAELKELIKQAAFAMESAQIDVDRLEKLQPDRNGGTPVMLISRVELDKARIALKDAQSKRKATQARLETSAAELKAIDEQLSLYALRAPITGRLGLVHAEPGQTLPVGTMVAEVLNLEEIDVLAFVPARTASQLRLDQTARLEGVAESPGDGSKAPLGKVVFLAEQAQAETGTVPVKARFANRDLGLRSNTLRRISVLTRGKADCLTVPESALLEDQEKPAVLVVTTEKVSKDGKEEEEHHVHKYEVKLGLRDHDKHRVEVLGLFDAKEKKDVPVSMETLFVTDGGHGLEDDDLVTLKKEEHEEPKKDDEKDHK